MKMKNLKYIVSFEHIAFLSSYREKATEVSFLLALGLLPVCLQNQDGKIPLSAFPTTQVYLPL